MRRFLARLARLTPREWTIAARRYEVAWRDAAAPRADAALADAIARTAREGARDALVGPVVQLARAAREAGLPRTDSDAPRVLPLPDEESLAEGALAAALAVLARDALSTEDYEQLVEPFASVAAEK